MVKKTKAKPLKKKKSSAIPPHKSKTNYQGFRVWFRMMLAAAIVGSSICVGTIAGVLASTFQVLTISSGNTGPGGSSSTLVLRNMGQLKELLFSDLNEKVNILVLGSDHNYSYGQPLPESPKNPTRSDTLMLAGIDPVNKKINILSIPRDTRAFLSGYHYDKINAALAYGGVELARQTVSDLTGVPIDYFMALKVDGLIKLVDLIGGIDIYVEKDMYYVDESAHLGINIHKGWKHMNGEQAHQYVRFRKDELGDIGRVQRQQKFIRAAIEQLLKPASLAKIPALLEGAQQNIKTDLPIEKLGQIAKFARGLNKEEVKMVMLPGFFSGSQYPVSYWIVNQLSAKDVILEMFPESSIRETLRPKRPLIDIDDPSQEAMDARARLKYKITIWNGTDDYRVSQMATQLLRDAGWNVWSVKKAKRLYATTRFVAQTGKSELLPQLQDALDIQGENVSASIGDITTNFTIILGQDFAEKIVKKLNEEAGNY